MRFALPLILLFAAHPAFAHVGHLGDLAGHGHWVAAGALGIAGLVAVWGLAKGRKEPPKAEESETDEPAEA